MISARFGPMPVTLRRWATFIPLRRVYSCRTCAAGTRSRSMSSRLDRATRATAAVTAEAVAEVAITRSHREFPSRSTAGPIFSSMNSRNRSSST